MAPSADAGATPVKTMDQRWLEAFYGPVVGRQLAEDLRKADGDEKAIAAALRRAIKHDKRIDDITNGVICTPPYSLSNAKEVSKQHRKQMRDGAHRKR